MAAGTSLHIVLVEPEIHWNTGNAGRTALAVGARLHLVRPLGFALTEREVRRAGLDYWKNVDPTIWSSWDELEPELSRMGEPFFFSTKAERDLWSVDFPDRAVLIFGSETRGLSDELRDRYRERLVKIPMDSTHVRSLNLSTSMAIGAFEVLRQWRMRG